MEERAGTQADELTRAATLFGAGQLDEAAAIYRALAAAQPGNPVPYANLGSVLHAQGRFEAALAALGEAARLAPTEPALHRTLTTCLVDWGFDRQRQGRLDDAIAIYRKALALDPRHAGAHNHLGTALLTRGEAAAAIEALRAALAAAPDTAEIHFNLGNALRAAGRLDDAMASWRRAVTLDPAHGDARINLGTALLDQGALPDALDAYRAVVARSPDWIGAHGNLLMALAYDPTESPVALRDAARAIGALLTERAGAPPPLVRDRDPDRRLRLGYVSADFRLHPVGWFIQAPMAHRDRAQFELFCYADRRDGDALTDRLRGQADHWRITAGLSDDEFAARVAADRIDILIDLAGASAHNRLAALARRLAPIQATWIGFPTTTGLPAIDCLFADARLMPPAADGDVTEAVVRLPEVGWCYTPPDFAPPVTPLPAAAAGHVTFGSFNNPVKLNPRVLALWARVLARVPEARLMVKFRGLDGGGARARLEADARVAGLALDRLILEGASPHPAALAAYGRVDIALDPFPFNGGTTTCEALWMGVPVITFPGATMAGRMGASFVAAAGFPELVARDADDAVERAVALAHDRDRLAALRARLRPTMAASPLTDGARFVAGFEAALRALWRQWCAAA